MADKLVLIEKSYNKFIENLSYWIPDGIYFINLELLNQLDLLHFHPVQQKAVINEMMNDFQMIESLDKMTLIGPKFIIWMARSLNDGIPSTYTLIALNQGEQEPILQVAIIAQGIYNNSSLILKVLEKFLEDINEVEKVICNYDY
jgi:hypothetical protein